MLLIVLGKILFPRHAEWERKRYVQMTIGVVAVAIILGAIIGGIIFYKNARFN